MNKLLCTLLAIATGMWLLCGCQNHEAVPSMSSSSSSSSPTAVALTVGDTAALRLHDGFTPSGMWELPNTLVVLARANDREDTGGFVIDEYSATDGSLKVSFTNEAYPDVGDLLRVDSVADKQGYNYRLLFEKAVVYRKAQSNSDGLVEMLPPITLQEYDGLYRFGNYDVYGDALTYANEAGVWLARRDGGELRLIVPHTEVTAQFADVPDGLYANPVFMNDGADVAIGIYRTLSYEFTGVVVYPVNADEPRCQLDVTLPYNVVYPVSDRFIVSRAWSPFSEEIRILDSQTDTLQDYPYPRENFSIFASLDYKTLVVAEYEDYPMGAKAYLCDIADLAARDRGFWQAGDGVAQFSAVTEHYVLINEDDTRWLLCKTS